MALHRARAQSGTYRECFLSFSLCVCLSLNQLTYIHVYAHARTHKHTHTGEPHASHTHHARAHTLTHSHAHTYRRAQIAWSQVWRSSRCESSSLRTRSRIQSIRVSCTGWDRVASPHRSLGTSRRHVGVHPCTARTHCDMLRYV
jgi:hypothetical protein